MDEHSKISRNAAVGVHGYLLVYAANSRASFERVKAIDDMLVDIHGGSLSVPRVVVATCIDLVDQRQVYAFVKCSPPKYIPVLSKAPTSQSHMIHAFFSGAVRRRSSLC